MKKDIIRQEQLLRALVQKGKLSIYEVVELLQVSESTARRIVIDMEKRKLLLRCFGGIQSLPSAGIEYSYDDYKNHNEVEKIAIGTKAAAFLNDYDSVFLSAGSTIRQAAAAILKRLLDGDLKEITVITNSMAVLEMLSGHCNIMIVGGIYRKKSQDVVGNLAEKNISVLRFNKAFIGTVSVDITEGFMTLDMEINSVMEKVVSRAMETYVLADSSKLNKTAFTRYAMIDEVAGIITDSNADAGEVDRFVNRGINLVVAQVPISVN